MLPSNLQSTVQFCNVYLSSSWNILSSLLSRRIYQAMNESVIDPSVTSNKKIDLTCDDSLKRKWNWRNPTNIWISLNDDYLILVSKSATNGYPFRYVVFMWSMIFCHGVLKTKYWYRISLWSKYGWQFQTFNPRLSGENKQARTSYHCNDAYSFKLFHQQKQNFYSYTCIY